MAVPAVAPPSKYILSHLILILPNGYKFYITFSPPENKISFPSPIKIYPTLLKTLVLKLTLLEKVVVPLTTKLLSHYTL